MCHGEGQKVQSPRHVASKVLLDEMRRNPLVWVGPLFDEGRQGTYSRERPWGGASLSSPPPSPAGAVASSKRTIAFASGRTAAAAAAAENLSQS